jgi:protein gp37
VSPGCKNCYAANLAATQQAARRVKLYEGTTDWVRGRPAFNGKLFALPPGHPGWTWPLTWKGAKLPLLGDGAPSLIFVGDMTDLFHEDRPQSHIDQVVGTLVSSRHIGLLLTKRPDVMAAYFSKPVPEQVLQRRQNKLWLGFSAERQQEFDERWAHMRQLAALGFVVFVSIAPMLRPITLPQDFLDYGDRVWVICSGEQDTGNGVRNMNPDWARALRDQCAEAGVPFNLLQMADRQEIPVDLYVRHFPNWRS